MIDLIKVVPISSDDVASVFDSVVTLTDDELGALIKAPIEPTQALRDLLRGKK